MITLQKVMKVIDVRKTLQVMMTLALDLDLVILIWKIGMAFKLLIMVILMQIRPMFSLIEDCPFLKLKYQAIL